MDKHTPTPWKLVDETVTGMNDRERYAIRGTGTDKKYIATIIPCAATPEQENMAFIVRAVNSHDALVAAAGKAEELLSLAVQ